MKKLFRMMALLGVMVMMCGCGREELKWEPDFKTGMKTAQEQGLAALIYFTGEGWCPQCKILDEKVLSGDEFGDFVKEKGLVTIKLNYPAEMKKESPGAAELYELSERYGVRGFPTMVLVNDAGCPFVVRVGSSDSPGEYLKEFREGMERVKRFDEHFAAAAKLTGEQRAQELWEAIKLVPMPLRPIYYSHTMEEIRSLDPQDKTGMVRLENEMKQAVEQMRHVDEEMGKALADVTPATALQRLREETLKQLDREDLMPFVRQSLYRLVAVTYLRQLNAADAVAYVEKAIEAAPDSPMAPDLNGMLKRVKASADISKAGAEQAKKAAEKATQQEKAQ